MDEACEERIGEIRKCKRGFSLRNYGSHRQKEWILIIVNTTDQPLKGG
jgi:hypothetical protein